MYMPVFSLTKLGSVKDKLLFNIQHLAHSCTFRQALSKRSHYYHQVLNKCSQNKVRIWEALQWEIHKYPSLRRGLKQGFYLVVVVYFKIQAILNCPSSQFAFKYLFIDQ